MISEQIDGVLEKRRRILPSIQKVASNIRAAYAAIQKLQAYQADAKMLPEEIGSRIAAISTTEYDKKHERVLCELNRLEERFSRPEIRLCLVGRARQGKSLLLQKISGLDGSVIPSSEGSHCTGARSVIYNSPKSEVEAEIEFYTETEYADIVNTYMQEIFGPTSEKVHSADDIRRIDLIKLKSEVPFDKMLKYDHFAKLVAHIDEYRAKFGKQITVPKEAIESHVAQYSSEDSHRKYYTYLAVRGARIHAKFPYEDCGKIVLVDTIGTGDTSLGIEEALLDTVRDSDATILLVRPDAMVNVVYNEEFELVNSIARELTPEYASEMLFWLLNRVEAGDGRNVKRVGEVLSTLSQQELPVAPRQTHE